MFPLLWPQQLNGLWGSEMLVLPTNSGESWSWSWLSGWAPCWRRKEAFSIRPRSTARKRGVWPRRVRLSTESGPETGEQGALMNLFFNHSSHLCFISGLYDRVKRCRISIKWKPLNVISRMVWLLWAAASWRGVQPLLSACENPSLCRTLRSFKSFSSPAGMDVTFESHKYFNLKKTARKWRRRVRLCEHNNLSVKPINGQLQVSTDRVFACNLLCFVTLFLLFYLILYRTGTHWKKHQ